MTIQKRAIWGGGLILLVLFIGFIIPTLRSKTFFCRSQDRVFCTFVKQVGDGSGLEIEGTISQTRNSHSALSLSWKLEKESEELVSDAASQNNLHIIRTPETVYLYDQSDKHWWEQSRKDADRYETKLPFAPKSFFTQLRTTVQTGEDPQFVGETTRYGSACRAYTLESETPTTICLNSKTSRVDHIEIGVGDEMTVIVVKSLQTPIKIPERGLKEAPRNLNIFAQVLQTGTNVVEDTPEYVRMFQQTRIQSETSGAVRDAPDYKEE